MDKIRLFIAIKIPSPIQRALNQIQSSLKTSNSDVAWVKTCNIHLTLKFLGFIEENRVNSIKERLNCAVKDINPFTAILSTKIDAFPALKHPRILWIGFQEGKEEIKKIQHKIDDNLSTIGIKKEEREFLAHLTLGRLKSNKNKELLIEQIEEIRLDKNYDMQISNVNLFQSTLTRTGPIYKILHEANLS